MKLLEVLQELKDYEQLAPIALDLKIFTKNQLYDTLQSDRELAFSYGEAIRRLKLFLRLYLVLHFPEKSKRQSAKGSRTDSILNTKSSSNPVVETFGNANVVRNIYSFHFWKGVS